MDLLLQKATTLFCRKSLPYFTRTKKASRFSTGSLNGSNLRILLSLSREISRGKLVRLRRAPSCFPVPLSLTRTNSSSISIVFSLLASLKEVGCSFPCWLLVNALGCKIFIPHHFKMLLGCKIFTPHHFKGHLSLTCHKGGHIVVRDTAGR